MKAGRAALVDVRSPAEFTGEILAPPGLPETCQRGGHPGRQEHPLGARSLQRGRHLQERRRSTVVMRRRGSVTPDRPVIAYCRISERSKSPWFVLKHLLGYRTSRTATDRGPSGATS